ncbi:oligosaccharide flippase family protein [Porphyromonas sp.]|uniref:oligosaccharide flippase family protein n=1 Tax=Porphyromonas sp. TaxID=1924944 RepID=UPI0026DAB422|nr:oligosaccharide flippase family protein [Porphyromonas sp.]MDO4770652.1 oligosaccharide flippase family protein [Porphyromonas sp.]
MSNIKVDKSTGLGGLAKDTVIYGITNIVSKFLNWLLAPFYIRILADSAEYGIVTNLYAWVSVILVVLTLGLETGLFRYMNTSDTPNRVYGTTLRILGVVVGLFLAVGWFFVNDIASGLSYPDHPEYIGIFVTIVSMDALLSLPFAYLRHTKRPLKFAFFKFLFIFLNIIFNIFFLVLCPWLYKHHPETISWFYRTDYGVGYIFISNLLATMIELLFMLPVIRPGLKSYDKTLVGPMLRYCLPLMLLGVMGNFSRMAGQILIPELYADKAYAMSQLGIYGGCLKISVVMVMFMQAFRFAYDPFVFSKMKKDDAPRAYRVAMNYFLLFTCIIFLGVMYWIDFFKHIVRPEYYEGLRIVPIVMASEIIFGIYYNLSMWYKLSDRTYFGTAFSLIGFVITVGLIIVFTPKYGYVACAWASLICNVVMMLLSYAFGRKYHPIEYDVLKLIGLGAFTMISYYAGMQIMTEAVSLRIALRTGLLFVFAVVALNIINPNFRQTIRQLRKS